MGFLCTPADFSSPHFDCCDNIRCWYERFPQAIPAKSVAAYLGDIYWFLDSGAYGSPPPHPNSVTHYLRYNHQDGSVFSRNIYDNACMFNGVQQFLACGGTNGEEPNRYSEPKTASDMQGLFDGLWGSVSLNDVTEDSPELTGFEGTKHRTFRYDGNGQVIDHDQARTLQGWARYSGVRLGAGLGCFIASTYHNIGDFFDLDERYPNPLFIPVALFKRAVLIVADQGYDIPLCLRTIEYGPHTGNVATETKCQTVLVGRGESLQIDPPDIGVYEFGVRKYGYVLHDNGTDGNGCRNCTQPPVHPPQ